MTIPRNKPPQIDLGAGAEGETPEQKHGIKERAKDQIKTFVLMFIYLWAVFGMLAVHESIVLSQHQINYRFHRLAIVNALVFAKVLLVVEDLHLGHRFNDKPLVYSILVKSLLFAVTLICFRVAEHVLIGMWDGRSIAQSIAEAGVNKLAGIVSLGIISTIALVPFFILREIGRMIGPDKLWSLFFPRRNW